jgi:hypothetical protein
VVERDLSKNRESNLVSSLSESIASIASVQAINCTSVVVSPAVVGAGHCDILQAIGLASAEALAASSSSAQRPRHGCAATRFCGGQYDVLAERRAGRR